MRKWRNTKLAKNLSSSLKGDGWREGAGYEVCAEYGPQAGPGLQVP